MVVIRVHKRIWLLDIANHFGATNEQIAKSFAVSISTLEQWTRDHPEFARAIKKGRDNHNTGKVELILLSHRS